jgi:acylphosphatase
MPQQILRNKRETGKTMKKRAHIIVSGLVQGVFFRDHTSRWASSLGLYGWVKNRPDGKVEVLAEGEKDQIDTLITHLQTGSPMSEVEEVAVEWDEHTGEYKDFRITW